MTPTPANPTPNRKTRLLFAALLVVGLVMLVVRTATRPDVSAGEMLVPALGGLAVAGVIALIVRQDRRDRAALPANQRDRQDHGTPN